MHDEGNVRLAVSLSLSLAFFSFFSFVCAGRHGAKLRATTSPLPSVSALKDFNFEWDCVSTGKGDACDKAAQFPNLHLARFQHRRVVGFVTAYFTTILGLRWDGFSSEGSQQFVQCFQRHFINFGNGMWVQVDHFVWVRFQINHELLGEFASDCFGVNKSWKDSFGKGIDIAVNLKCFVRQVRCQKSIRLQVRVGSHFSFPCQTIAFLFPGFVIGITSSELLKGMSSRIHSLFLGQQIIACVSGSYVHDIPYRPRWIDWHTLGIQYIVFQNDSNRVF